MTDTTEKELADSVTLRTAEETDLAAATKATLEPNEAQLPLEFKQDKSDSKSLLALEAKPSIAQTNSCEASLIPAKNPGRKRRRGKPVLRAMRVVFAFVLAIPSILIALSGYELVTDPSASHIMKSMIFEQIHDQKSQLSEMDAALKLKDNPFLRKNRADLLMNNNNYLAARDEYQRILDSGSEDPDVFDSLASCRMMDNQDDLETLRDIQQAFDLSSSIRQKRSLVLLLVLDGKYGGAQPLLHKLIPTNVNATWMKALDILQTPNTSNAWMNAIILERTGKLAEARAAYEAIDATAFHSELSWSRAMFYLGGNELAKARAELDKQEKQHQSNCSLRGLLEAWYSLQAGDYSKALANSEMSTKNIKNIEHFYQEVGVYWANHKLRALVYEKQGDTKNLEKEKEELRHIVPLWHIYVPRNFN